MKRGAVACFVAALALSGIAHADPTAADRVTARGLMQQGRDLRDKGDLAGALKRFKGADDIMHAPTTGLELARTQVALGMLVEARDTLAAVRRIPVKPNEPGPFKEARGKVEELDTDLSVRVPLLTISLKGTPEGEKATVTLDTEALAPGVVGLPRPVNPGHHVVTAKSASAEGKAEIDVREGDQKPLEVTLVATHDDANANASADASESAPEEAPAPPSRSHGPTLLTWAGVGLGVVGVGVGAVAGAMSLSKKSALAKECTNDICGPSSYGDYNAASSLATVSTVGFAVAGVGAAVAVVTLAVGHKADATAPAPASGLRMIPWVGLGAGGVRGSF
jgi:hypothetical protein